MNNRELCIKNCLKRTIDKINADYELAQAINYELDLEDEYLKGKAQGIIESVVVIEEVYKILFGDEKNERDQKSD